MRYWNEAALLAVGLSALVIGALTLTGGYLPSVALIAVGAFLAAYGLFTGVETATRAGTGGDVPPETAGSEGADPGISGQ